ncbi:hypothetical protein l13_12750 [Neisseria weaveri ATCC 51223]|nr:hypothetical protein l13_12750 [Neisseria weaveri ATCC 51223]
MPQYFPSSPAVFVFCQKSLKVAGENQEKDWINMAALL